jgi:DNA-binding SARP family transcriptional activator
MSDPSDATPEYLTGWRLWLFGPWRLTRFGRQVPVGLNGQRLLALLAIKGGQHRAYLAGMLWPEASEAHAHGNLRATLSRLHQRRLMDFLDVSGSSLALLPQVSVDVHDFLVVASSVLDGRQPDPFPTLTQLTGEDLLPGWYEDWVLVHRERLRQLRLHALERVSTMLLGRCDYPAALDSALAAIAIEPLRESAHRVAISVHLAEGNRVEAMRQFEHLSRLLRDELGVVPSKLVTDLFR